MELFSNKGEVLNINTTTTSVGGGSSIWNEEPSGVRDGTNKIFTTGFPFITRSTRVTKNGLRMKLGIDYDYIESGANQITFNYNILSTASLIIDYDVAAE